MIVGRGQRWFRPHNTYYAIYNEGYDLQPGVKVKLLRTDIGQVTTVELTDENKAKVTMSVLAEYASRITVDSRAAIESPTIIASEFINIIPGKSKEIIPPGHVIPSTEAKGIIAYIEEFDLDYKMKRLDEILENLTDITDRLNRPNAGLMAALDNIEEITRSIKQGEGTLGQVISDDQLYNEILARLDEIEGILSTAQKAADKIDAGMDQIEPGMASVRQGAESLEAITEELENRIPTILTQVQEVLLDLERAMVNVPDISDSARRGLRDVNDILESVKRNFLIRGNLPPSPRPESHGLEIRGD